LTLWTFPVGQKNSRAFDTPSKLYWSLANVVGEKTAAICRCGAQHLALICSPDLRRCRLSRTPHHENPASFGFQYADWQFARRPHRVVRRRSPTRPAAATNYHDANYLTFHRVNNFRASAEPGSDINGFELSGNGDHRSVSQILCRVIRPNYLILVR